MKVTQEQFNKMLVEMLLAQHELLESLGADFSKAFYDYDKSLNMLYGLYAGVDEVARDNT